MFKRKYDASLDYFFQQALVPHSSDDRPVISLELALTMHHIVLEHPTIHLSIRQDQLPQTLLGVSLKLSFILHPLLLQNGEIGVVEASLNDHGVIVVDCP